MFDLSIRYINPKKIYGYNLTLQLNATRPPRIDSLSDFPELVPSNNANMNKSPQLRESETQDEVSELCDCTKIYYFKYYVLRPWMTEGRKINSCQKS